MKKIMVVLAIVAAVFTANAASLSWSVMQIKNSADSSVAGAGYIGYFFEDNGSTVTTSAIAELLDAGKYADAVALASYSKAATATGAINSTGNGSYAAGTSVTGFAVVFDAATPADASNYIMTSAITKVAPTTGAISMAFGSQANATYSSVGGGGDVPEPTSGLLLLVGGAMLALRRKQK